MKSSFPDLIIPDLSFPDYIKEKIQQFGEDIALIDNADGRTITFKELDEQSNKLSFALVRLGLKKGDIVGLCARNCIEFPVMFLGILACGAAVIPCPTEYTPEKIVEQFSATKPRFLIFENEYKEKMDKVVSNLPSVEKVFSIHKSLSSTSIEELISEQCREENIPRVDIDSVEDLAGIFHSSGTTGKPKGAMFTHKGLVSNIEIWRTQVKQFPSNCSCTDRPLSHRYAMVVMFSSLANGARVVLDKMFSLEKMLLVLEKYKVTHLAVGISTITSLAKTEVDSKFDTSSLSDLIYGGTTISSKLIERVGKKFGCHMCPGYGMTECAPMAIGHPAVFEASSTGVISYNTAVKICKDTTGAEMQVGQIGNIIVKGPQIMKGYFANPQATLTTIDKDGWLHTGDVGYLDKNGLVYIIGRRAELIKYRDTLIAPAELEEILLQHPLILEAGVIGVPDDEGSEVPRAYVVVKDQGLDEQKVMEIIKEKLPVEKHLRGGVGFVDEIPISLAGKIDRLRLLQIYQENLNGA